MGLNVCSQTSSAANWYNLVGTCPFDSISTCGVRYQEGSYPRLHTSAGFVGPASPVASANRLPAARMSAVDDVMEKLKTMTLVEAAELVKAIEETFDVDASAAGGGGMMMMAPGAAAGGDAPAAAEEKTEFDLVLEEFPADKKIPVLKIVREITGLGLKEAKELVEGAPKALKSGAAKAECEEAQKKLEELGAKVTLK